MGSRSEGIVLPMARMHRRHSSELKSRIIEACLQPGVSLTGVAVANQLNPNVVRRWVKAHRSQDSGKDTLSLPVEASKDLTALSGFVPVTVPAASVDSPGDIRIEIRRLQLVVQVDWPVSQSASCAQWLRELLA
jgi:transposase